MRVELWAGTADDTRAVGEAFAGLLRPRHAVILTGESVRKDHPARGSGARWSRRRSRWREYHGRLEVAHVDVYRLERIQDVLDLGLEELADGEAVLLLSSGVTPSKRHSRPTISRVQRRAAKTMKPAD